MQMPLHVIFKLVRFMPLMVVNKQESLPNGAAWSEGGAAAGIHTNAPARAHADTQQKHTLADAHLSDEDAGERKRG